jgi:hypothetical protein
MNRFSASSTPEPVDSDHQAERSVDMASQLQVIALAGVPRELSDAHGTTQETSTELEADREAGMEAERIKFESVVEALNELNKSHTSEPLCDRHPAEVGPFKKPAVPNASVPKASVPKASVPKAAPDSDRTWVETRLAEPRILQFPTPIVPPPKHTIDSSSPSVVTDSTSTPPVFHNLLALSPLDTPSAAVPASSLTQPALTQPTLTQPALPLPISPVPISAPTNGEQPYEVYNEGSLTYFRYYLDSDLKGQAPGVRVSSPDSTVPSTRKILTLGAAGLGILTVTCASGLMVAGLADRHPTKTPSAKPLGPQSTAQFSNIPANRTQSTTPASVTAPQVSNPDWSKSLVAQATQPLPTQNVPLASASTSAIPGFPLSAQQPSQQVAATNALIAKLKAERMKAFQTLSPLAVLPAGASQPLASAYSAYSVVSPQSAPTARVIASPAAPQPVSAADPVQGQSATSGSIAPSVEAAPPAPMPLMGRVMLDSRVSPLAGADEVALRYRATLLQQQAQLRAAGINPGTNTGTGISPAAQLEQARATGQVRAIAAPSTAVAAPSVAVSPLAATPSRPAVATPGSSVVLSAPTLLQNAAQTREIARTQADDSDPIPFVTEDPSIVQTGNPTTAQVKDSTGAPRHSPSRTELDEGFSIVPGARPGAASNPAEVAPQASSMLQNVQDILRLADQGRSPLAEQSKSQARSPGGVAVRPIAIARGAAQQVQLLSEVPGFRVINLGARDYQQQWRTSTGSKDGLAPLYGFVDYQRQVIVVAVPKVVVGGLVSPDAGVLPDAGVVSSAVNSGVKF